MRVMPTALATVAMACSLLVAGATSAPHYGPILNTNGDFEQGTTAYHFTRPKQMALDQEEVYRGFSALRIQGENTTDRVEDTILVQGFESASATKRDFRLTVAIKAKGVNAEYPFRAQVAASYGKGKPNYEMPLEQRITVAQDGEWTLREMILRDVPPEITKLHLWFVLPHQSGATVWIDNIEVREILK